MALISALQVQQAVQSEREKVLRESMDALTRDVSAMREEIGEIHSMANRWKGGFLVLAGVGGTVGWVMSMWTSVISFFHK